MSKVVFMFPGQGAQYIGMGKDFYDACEESKAVYELASKVTGLDIAKLCFEENEEINITEYTQIAMLTTEAAIYAALKKAGKEPAACAGLSLGEYGALIASGVMSMEDAFRVVRARGIFMQEAVPTGGAMAAVLGLDAKAIEEVCSNTEGIVSIANYNCPGQIVITGKTAAVEKAAESLKAAGAKRAVLLNVSGPFHSKMLESAGEELAKEMEKRNFEPLAIPYVTNVTAKYVTDIKETKALLAKQISSPVRWEESVRTMIEDGVDTFVEIGPGKTLAGFMRRIDKSVKVYNIETWEDMEKVIAELV